MKVAFSIFMIFLRLGCTSFGGPIAHLAYFRDEFVERRKWLSAQAYGDLVALCQFIPGPASSQVGISLGLSRGGILGAFAAWSGFTMPSAVLLILFGIGFAKFSDLINPGAIQGLKIVAVAIIAQAILMMAKTLCPDRPRAVFALLSALFLFALPTAFGQWTVIAGGGLLGYVFLRTPTAISHAVFPIVWKCRYGGLALFMFFALLILLPFVGGDLSNQAFLQFARFYRSGALVFGGGHVVLPLLQAEVVPRGWVSADDFLAGYGVTQAMPGPLFTFAAYLGAISKVQPCGWIGGFICLLGIFLPGFLLTIGMLPLWQRSRSHPAVQKIMRGASASVVGILISAFIHPVWSSAVHNWRDLVLAFSAFVLLVYAKTPPWIVVVACAAGGHLISF